MSDDPQVRAQARAQAWVAHLRGGGTAPWVDYQPDDEGPVVDIEERLPGAQQLELLRRINHANHSRADHSWADEGVAKASELVLRASLTGRGQPERGLIGVPDPSARNPRPESDPATLPDGELLRVAASAIADSLVLGGLPEPLELPPPRRRHRPFQLVGNPWLTIPLRHELALAGHPAGGPRSRAFVLAGPFEQLMVDAWSAACFDTGPIPWDAWLAKRTARDQPPARVDLVRIAARHQPRARSVDVVWDPSLLRGLLGVRRQITVPEPLSAHALEIARRVAVVLGGLVSKVERTTLLRGRLLPALSRLPGPRLVVPAAYDGWMDAQAKGMRSDLQAAGYAEHGRTGAAPHHGGPEAPDRTLEDSARDDKPDEPSVATPVVERPTDADALEVAIQLLGSDDW
jgi:hypothetical protein